MKTIHIAIILLLNCFIILGCDNRGKTPSIKDNSNRTSGGAPANNYSNLTSNQLYKHVLAHYDLEEFKKGKAKLKFLMNAREDLIDSLGLAELQEKFDTKLKEVKEREEALAEKESKSRMHNAIKKMRIIEEDNVKYYFDDTSPKFDSNEAFYAYYTKDRVGKLDLRLKIRYIDTNWLNIENFLITVDELDYELTGPIVQSETRGKKIYKHELLDISVDNLEKLELLKAIANSKEVKAAYIGKATYKERVLSNEQRLAVRNVLDAYLFESDMNMKQLTAKVTN